MGHTITTAIIVESQSTHMIEHSRGEQTLIGCLVEPLPHLKSHTAFPPFHILMFANDTTLREKSTGFCRIAVKRGYFIN